MKEKWYSIREAAAYLEIGEPTLYRWMRENKITFRKVGDSTRFLQADLDAPAGFCSTRRGSADSAGPSSACGSSAATQSGK